MLAILEIFFQNLSPIIGNITKKGKYHLLRRKNQNFYHVAYDLEYFNH